MVAHFGLWPNDRFDSRGPTPRLTVRIWRRGRNEPHKALSAMANDCRAKAPRSETLQSSETVEKGQSHLEGCYPTVPQPSTPAPPGGRTPN